MTNLPDRLKRYSKNAIAYALDPDFAEAVWEAADEIEDMTYDIDCFNDEITAMFGTNQALLDFAHFVAEEVVVDGDEILLFLRQHVGGMAPFLHAMQKCIVRNARA